jgi:hypothetical protein
MKSLDDLLSSAGRVSDITPEGLRNARAALDATIAGAATRQNAAPPELDRKRASRWHGGWPGGWRGRTLVGVTAVAAAAAAAAAFIAVTAAPAPHTAAPAAVSPVRPTVKASGKATAKPKPAFHVGFSAPTSDATAAQLLDEAATAAGSQQGWPDASYWYAESEDTSLLTGKTTYSANWSDRHGSGVTAQGGTPIPEQSTDIPSLSSLPVGSTAVGAIGVSGDSAPFYGYTWPQLYALPTDNTAELESDLMTTGDIHFGPKAPGSSWTGQEDLFGLITNLLSGTPASPALREALYRVAATIPGVTVKGTYTDSLGRTGTALQLGPLTAVIDPATGQYLDGMTGLLPGEVNCSKITGMCQMTDPATDKIENGAMESGPSSGLLITQGPATGLPTIVG